MDLIYPPKGFLSSEHISLNKYFQEFQSELVDGNLKNRDKDSVNGIISKISGLPIQEVELLSDLCDIDNLLCENEDNETYPVEDENEFELKASHCEIIRPNENGKKLETVKCREGLKNHLENVYLRIPRFIYYKVRQQTHSKNDLRAGCTFVATIQIYRPFVFRYFQYKSNLSTQLKLCHEIIALGTNTLGQVRDVIRCVSDGPTLKEVESTKVDLDKLPKNKDKYPSGFIFIDNTFYNDFRHPNAIDYSAPILQWAKSKDIKPLKTTNINAKIESLSPILGYPYLYQHQGDCEHIFVFSDVKLLQKSDILKSASYPYVKRTKQKHSTKCIICTIQHAKWMLTDCDRYPFSKVFLCTECCDSFNFINGKKVGNFKLYPYLI